MSNGGPPGGETMAAVTECEHICGTGIGDHLSWCAECLGDVRYRDNTGETDDITLALDRLGVRIVPDHIQRSEEDQWRLIAGDLAMRASAKTLWWARQRHEQRVGTVPDFDPASDEVTVVEE